MSTVTKNAILKAKIEGVITDLMVKTTSANVYVDDTTTLSSKLSEIITDIGTRAKSSDVTAEINTAINGLINGAPETYNTLKEIADYIETHEDVVTALNEAVGSKVSNDTFTAFKNGVDTLGSLASKSSVSEAELESTLKTKINNAATNSHSHSNKSVLDGITANNVTEWNSKVDADDFNAVKNTVDGLGSLSTKDSVSEAELESTLKTKINNAATKSHSHSNKSVLDGITANNVTEWNSKGTFYAQATEPSTFAEGDLWAQIIS